MPLKVFISYSHDSDEHKCHVWDLSARLRKDGIESIIDQYEDSPADKWPLWCEKQIRDADFVLVVCTKTYNRRVMKEDTFGEGLGVTWEAEIIRNNIYDSGCKIEKYIPIVFSKEDLEYIPSPLKGTTRYITSNNAGYQALLNRLIGRKKTIPATSLSVVTKTLQHDEKIRKSYVNDVKKDLDARLKASIQHEWLIDLDIKDNPEAITSAWGYHNPEIKRSYATLVDAFYGCKRRLLLLGAPGSGKTTALLLLAKHLVDKAEKYPDEPVPFIVNLTKFQLINSEKNNLFPFIINTEKLPEQENGESEFDRSFEDWFINEMCLYPYLKNKREIARKWIHEGRVAVMLDGLDEFNDERRAELVRLLNNSFLGNYPDITVIICSRTNEYAVLQSKEETRLQLCGCIHLEPLNDRQITDYLTLAQAQNLKKALPDYPTLQELAKTPLTLSMLVIAYGGISPVDMPKKQSLSESRHHLFETYVERMLQRCERRKNNRQYDNVKANDIPVSKYTYPPEKVKKWLGWLALSLSVRFQTSFSFKNIFNILGINIQTDRQLINVVAVYFTIGILLVISLGIIAIPIVPKSSPEITPIVLIIFLQLLIFILSGLLIQIKTLESLTHLFILIPLLFAILFNTIMARYLCSVLPMNISAFPLSIILFFMIANSWFFSNYGFSDRLSNFQKALLSFVIFGIVVVVILQFLPVKFMVWHLDRELIQVLTIIIGICIISIIFGTINDRYCDIGITIGFIILIVGAQYWIPYLNQIIDYIVIGTVLTMILIHAMFKKRTSNTLNILFSYTLLTLTGGIVGGYFGAFLSILIFGLGFAIWSALKVDDIISEEEDGFGNWLWVESNFISKEIIGRIEKHILSPCLRIFLLLGKRFPWKYNEFLLYCKDAFLIKQSSFEYEFIHRFLRDYFALNKLYQILSGKNKLQHLDVIPLLGYQGESALDFLMEFLNEAEPSVRAAALSALCHISSPSVVHCFEYSSNDREPEVRQAIIRGIFKLPSEDRERILKELKPLGDGCEIDPLFDILPLILDRRYKFIDHDEFDEIIEFIERMEKSIVINKLRIKLFSPNKLDRYKALIIISLYMDKVEQTIISKDIDGYKPWLDPARKVSKRHIARCSHELGITSDEVINLFVDMDKKYGLKFYL